MKTAIAVLVLLCATTVNAYEIQENPDRKISFGLNYGRWFDGSEYKFGGIKISDFSKTNGNNFIGDVRIPMSSLFTFQIRGGYSDYATTTFANENIDHKGYDFGFGVRLYLP